MVNFNEDNVVINTKSILTMEYVPSTTGKLVVSKLYNDEFEYIKPVYKNFRIESVNITDGEMNGKISEFRIEVREFDMILPSGVGNDTPRRSPTELSYKGKKLKNKFM